MNISNNLRDKLKEVVRPDEPLGPVDLADIADLEVQKQLFESENKIGSCLAE